MDAQTAFNQLKPQDWADTSAATRLAFIEEIQDNLKKYAQELGDTDAKMKNELLGEDFITSAEGMGATAWHPSMRISRTYSS